MSDPSLTFLAFLVHQRFSNEEEPARGDVGLDERLYVAIELQCHGQDDGMQLSRPAEWATRPHKKKGSEAGGSRSRPVRV